MEKYLLRIMSHNLWKNDLNKPEWEAKGADCSAETRSKGFVRVYKELEPHIIGCQEMSALMAEKIMCGCIDEGLKYALLWGKDTPVLYRPDVFEVIDSDFSLYPDNIPDYEGVFNNSKTKSWCIAVMRVKGSGKCFVFASTHLWWKSSNPNAKNYQPNSDKARAYQIRLLIERLEQYRNKYSCPVVIVGDLNAGYDSLCLKAAFECGYSHAHDIATEYADEKVGLHYCFGDGYEEYYYDFPFERGIDHILVKGMEEHAVNCFKRYSPEYYFPLSDHSPVFIDFTI